MNWKWTVCSATLIFCLHLSPVSCDQHCPSKTAFFTEPSFWRRELESVNVINGSQNLNDKRFLADWLCQEANSWPALGINEQCARNMKDWICSLAYYFNHRESTDQWAVRVLDAAGKPPSGITELKLQWFGAYDECRDIHHKVDKDDEMPRAFVGRYCQLVLSTYSNKTTQECSPFAITVGLCSAQTCSTDDLNTILGKYHNITSALFCNLGVSCESVTPPFYLDLPAVLASVFLILVLFCATTGTLYDCFHSETRNIAWVWKFFVCFSLFSNGQKILSTERRSGSLDCVHGIRVLSMFWVMYGHTYYFIQFFVANPLLAIQVPAQFLFQIINNATVSVDTFFMLSGFLLSYLFLRRMRNPDNHRDLKSPRFWIYFYVHRYLRLTPVYMIAIFLMYSFWNQIGDGPMWPERDRNGLVGTCPQDFWRNALYINNLFDWSAQCIGWSWYLANDMQFYWISPILLVLLVKRPKIAFGVGVAVIGCSNVYRGIAAFIHEFPPTITSSVDPIVYTTKLAGYSDVLYDKPWARIGTYLIGVLFGYVMHVTQGRVKLNKFMVMICWILTVALTNTVLFGLYNFASTGELNQVVSASYTALGRSAWAVAVCATVFLCLHGYGGPINAFLSWNGWFPIGRITYCAYLVHEYVIYYLYATSRTKEYASHYLLFFTFASATCFTFGLAFIVSILFEAPFMQLEKLILPGAGSGANKNKKTNVQKITPKEPEIQVMALQDDRQNQGEHIEEEDVGKIEKQEELVKIECYENAGTLKL